MHISLAPLCDDSGADCRPNATLPATTVTSRVVGLLQPLGSPLTNIHLKAGPWEESYLSK